ncbi:MAG: hypothetical protein CXT73_05690 [Methanobacteriota archaeon]|nr:MAG: hypothetical protein CXT73_05690 [Euryarchaeota archaeon]
MVNIPILSTGQNVMSKINGAAQEIVTKVTNTDLISTAGKGVNGILKDLGDLVGVVPLAGGATGYVFKKSGDAVKVVSVSANNVVVGSGKLVNGVLSGVTDLVVLTLDTAKGLISKISNMVGVNIKLGGRRRRRRRKSKKRRKRTGKKSRKKRRRRTKRRRRR